MKRRLNILCVIVVLVLSYSIIEHGYYFFMGAKLGAEAGMEAGKEGLKSAEYKELRNLKVIGVVARGYSHAEGRFFTDSVYNEKSGEYVPASYSSMVVSVDTNSTLWDLMESAILTFVHVGVSIWAVILFIRLIISINKSDIFNWRNVRRLRFLGVALIVSFCAQFLLAYSNMASVSKVFSIPGYDLSLAELVSMTTLVLGLCSLIVGEVFAIGLKMKEEQDLTI